MGRHGWWMILGCVLPLLLIFFAPAAGWDQNWGLFLFIAVMFICHFGMMGMHGAHGRHRRPPSPDENRDEEPTGKEPENHGAH